MMSLMLYTPQQNGVAKGMNRTLMEKVCLYSLMLVYLNLFMLKLSL